MPVNLEVPDWGLLLPQLIVFIMTFVVALLDAFLPQARQYTVLTAVSLIGYGAATVALIGQAGKNEATFSGLFRADGLTVFLSLVILAAAILTVLTSA